MANLTRTLDLSKITDAAWWGLARDDGGDVRATDHGNVILPMHILEFDKSLRKGVVNVYVADASPVRMWSGTGETSQPAVDAVTGQYAAYDPSLYGSWPAGTGTDVTAAALAFGDTANHATDDTLYTGATITQVANGSSILPEVALPGGSGLTIEFWFNNLAGGSQASASVGVLADPAVDAETDNEVGIVQLSAANSGDNQVLASYLHAVYDDTVDPGPLLVPDSDAFAVADALTAGWHHAVMGWSAGAPLTLVVDGISYDPASDIGDGLGGLDGANVLAMNLESDATGDVAKIALLNIYTEQKSVAWAQARYTGYVSPGGVSTLNGTAWPH